LTAGCLLPAFVILIRCGDLGSSPEARAGCGNAARPDLWRGSWVTMTPTPTLSTLSRRHQKSASGRVPPPFDAPPAGQAIHHLGWPAQSSQPLGTGLCPPTARTPVAGIPSGLCARTQSGGVSVVALETTRTTQLLPEHLRAVEPACSPRAQADAPAPNPGDGFLAASAAVSFVSILCGTQ
jgi:hypothetical protein